MGWENRPDSILISELEERIANANHERVSTVCFQVLSPGEGTSDRGNNFPGMEGAKYHAAKKMNTHKILVSSLIWEKLQC